MKSSGKRMKKNLAAKLSIFITGMLLLTFLLLTLVIAVSTGKKMLDEQNKRLVLLAEINANTAKSFVESMVYKQEAVIKMIQGLDLVEEQDRLPYIKSVITGIQQDEEKILSLFYAVKPSKSLQNGLAVYATPSHEAESLLEYQKIVSERDYESAELQKGFSIIDPHKKMIDGKEYMVITLIQPILDKQNNVLGVVGSDIETRVLHEENYNNGGFETFSNRIICGHETVIVNTTRQDIVGSKFVDTTNSLNPNLILDTVKEGVTKTFVDELKDGSKQYRACVPFQIAGNKTIWLSCTGITEAEFAAPIVEEIILVFVYGIVASILLTIIIYGIIRKSLKPMKEIEHAAKEISEGNLSIDIKSESEDEIGRLAESLRTSIAIISSYIQDIDRAMNEMANGNFDLQPGQPFIGDFKSIEDSITHFIVKMSGAFSNMNAISTQVSGGSEQVAHAAQSMAEGVLEQATAVEELFASVAEVSVHVESTANNALQAKTKAEQAGEAVELSSSSMQAMMNAISDISEKSTEIGKIIKTIEGIASQTNLLALNVAVEAARAGEAGKGFAVIAQEVRELANKSAEAVKSTASLIKETVYAVDNGSKIAEETEASMASVTIRTKEAIDLIIEIANASEEQARAVGQIKDGVEQISVVVERNSSTAEESAASSEELSGQADTLKNAIDEFKIKNFGK